jgi:hypothetical protein
MSYHYSNNPLSPTSSLRSAAPTTDNLRIYETARTVQDTEHETERAGAAAARWSAAALRPLPSQLRERVKTGLRAVRAAASGPPIPHDDQPSAAFSALGGPGGRLFLAQMPPDAPPPTVVWGASQSVAWGQWPCQTFTHCITILTERNARAIYEIDADAEMLPVNASALDGVAHLWLIVPPRSHHHHHSAGSLLSDEQMCAAVEFAEDAAVGQMLIACAERNEVDVAALAVLLLARRCSRTGQHVGERASSFQDRRHHQRGGGRALAGCAQTYQAARMLDDDPGVSLVWKGLLGWQDVERVQAVLWTCDRSRV